MSKGSKAKRDAFGVREPEPLDDGELDSLEPDYSDKCQNCEESPTVTGERHGRVVVRWHLCGPCCFGEARMIDPRAWNE
jgi:hypothetical protein